MPALQFTPEEDAVLAGQKWPALHGPSHSGDVSPAPDPNLPAPHGPEHDETFKPLDDPYRPGVQALQLPAPAKLYVPTGHTDAVAVDEPAMQL